MNIAINARSILAIWVALAVVIGTLLIPIAALADHTSAEVEADMTLTASQVAGTLSTTVTRCGEDESCYKEDIHLVKSFIMAETVRKINTVIKLVSGIVQQKIFHLQAEIEWRLIQAQR